jgi:hypothetical protein
VDARAPIMPIPQPINWSLRFSAILFTVVAITLTSDTIQALAKRKINSDTCKVFNYEIGFYKDKPVNLKTTSIVAQDLGPKYKKVSFSNSGHAHNLAERLNKMFNCQDFSVYKLTTGEKLGNESAD